MELDHSIARVSTEGIRTRTFVLIWLGIAAIFVGSHFSFYFFQPHYEGGDFAANALQIRQAKVFHELYGNYSRFGFHHPGPAFFYLYAWGEIALSDFLRIVPAPYNAHAIVGILVQAFFFVLALRIIARRIRHPLIVPLLLAFAAAHFSIVNFSIPGSAFQSIWPPYVLLCPFLCFLVACASLASGQLEDLSSSALAGSLLVHGHVAQSLFVIVMFSVAYIAFWVGRFRKKERDQLVSRQRFFQCHLFAIAIVGVFLVPLIIDACKGEASNLRGLFEHFSSHDGDRKSFAQSLVYLAAFFYYLGNPQVYCDQLTLSKLTFLADRWPFFWMWFVIAIVIFIAPKPSLSSERRFFHWLVSIFFIAIVLTIVWGRLQNAEMFAFNAYFNFGLLFVPFILLGIVLVPREQFIPLASLALPLFVIAIVLGVATAKSWAWHSDPFSSPTGTAANVETVRKAALEDEQPARTKFLSFQHGVWDWAAGVALALERFGYDYAVPSNWGFIFGRKHVEDLVASIRSGQVALWTVSSPAVSGDNWISNSPPSVNPSNSQITFAGPDANAQGFVVSGWDVSTGPFSWSTDKIALLYFRALPASSDVEIQIQAFPFKHSRLEAQRMSVSFNNGLSQTFSVADGSTFSLSVPASVWNQAPNATLVFEFPDSASPREVGLSSDGRTLGCAFTRIDFQLVNTPASPGS